MKEFRFVFLVWLCLFLFFPVKSNAEVIDLPPAVPVDTVEVQSLLPPPQKATKLPKIDKNDISPILPKEKVPEITIPKGDGLVVLELFSTQACTFCPKADALMEHFMDRKDIIALSCHVDYFDVEQGSLALPICSTRQVNYEGSLDIGPKYTPQMVFNGRVDAIGYREQEVLRGINQARSAAIIPLSVYKNEDDTFLLSLPSAQTGTYKVWLFVYEPPVDHVIQSGANKGKAMTYYNLISKAGYLGAWDGRAKALKFNPKLADMSKGFVVIVQDNANNHIIAATKFEE